MRKAILIVAALAILATGAAAQQKVYISLGVREQNLDPNAYQNPTPVGGFHTATASGSPGQIEWFALDQQQLILDGTWQQFTFNMADISPTSFTGNGIIDTDKGILEHIRVKSAGQWISYPFNIEMWFDRLAISYDPAGPPPPVVDQVMTTFAVDPNTGLPFANGQEVTFQEPGFSGSTSGNIAPAPAPNVSGIDNAMGYDDLSSVKASFRFIDGTDTRWVRYTTYRVPAAMSLPNPVIPLVKAGGAYVSASVTFWMRGLPEPASLLLAGLGALLLRRR